MARNWKAALVGALLLALLLAMSGLFSTQTGYFSMAFTTPTPFATTQFTVPPPTQEVTPTPRLTPTPRFTLTPQFTLTPEFTSTPVRPCVKHINGVALLITMTENGFLIKSTDACLMMSTGGGSVGQPTIGTLVEKSITIRQKDYAKYYEFEIPFNADRTSSKGIYFEIGTYWEFIKSDFGSYGWVEEYTPGEYWFLMKFLTNSDQTATATS